MNTARQVSEPIPRTLPFLPKPNVGGVFPILPKTCTNFPSTEFESKYVTPHRNKKPTTRGSLMEQFWWHEFYEEYLKYLQRNIKPHPMPKTEYTEKYEREVRKDTADKMEDLVDKYPIYASNAITLWNKSGDKTCTFRRAYSITRPVQEQFDTQFG